MCDDRFIDVAQSDGVAKVETCFVASRVKTASGESRGVWVLCHRASGRVNGEEEERGEKFN